MVLINELIDYYSYEYRNQQMRRIEAVLRKRNIDKYVIYRCLSVFDELVYIVDAPRYQLEITESKIIFQFLDSEFQNPVLLDFTKQLESHSNTIYTLSNTENGICFQPAFDGYLKKEERKQVKEKIKTLKIYRFSDNFCTMSLVGHQQRQVIAVVGVPPTTINIQNSNKINKVQKLSNNQFIRYLQEKTQ